MSSLSSPLRKQLETAIKAARKTAEAGARKALEALAVHEADPYRHMDDAQRTLRRKLRAQARQLGDAESHSRPGTYDIQHLAEKVAYDQWHRLLFARFLLENGLLISPEHEVSVTLADCEELAPSLGLRDAWAVAGKFTAAILPEAFRADDPAGTVHLPIEERNQLLRLLAELPVEVFTATDSLGWTYQFWQAEQKEAVNKAGNKIGADELPSVTQLFTEDYMVDFLLDNTLGAWHAGKVLATNPKLAETAQSEDELRQVVALPDCSWKYLRFIKDKDGNWTPAAGTFDGWPKSAAAIRALDPCMGSGHFVVAMFERLVALRLAEETLDEAAAVAAVIRDNLFGLEIDPRCTQIGAFNLALAAWRRVGHCKLPAMNLACSGLAPNTREADWLALAGDNQKLRSGMERLYRLFKNAPVLGSLINPRAGEDDLLVAAFHELQPLLEKALAQETQDVKKAEMSTDLSAKTSVSAEALAKAEMAVTARGLAKAAEILAGQFTLVATNVPYLGYKKQDELLKVYSDRVHPDSRYDLATCFIERSVGLCAHAGSTALVVPQNWLFLGSYKRLRVHLLENKSWDALVKLGGGAEAFNSGPGNITNVALLILSHVVPPARQNFVGCDVSAESSPDRKAANLKTQSLIQILQSRQLTNPDSRIVIGESEDTALLQAITASALSGCVAGDALHFVRSLWEIPSKSTDWEFHQTTVRSTSEYGGKSEVILWEREAGEICRLAESVRHLNHVAQNWRRGKANWGKRGVAVSQMGELSATLYLGDIYDSNCCAIVPKETHHLSALWAFCSSPDYSKQVRKIDQKLNVTSATLIKVPFDLTHWQKVAAEKYPHGLPKPFSSDPTQWLFNGYPAGADQPLHVAVARLLGYQWPRQTGFSFPDCPALGPDGLETLADDDGIVPISPVKGEGPAADRLRELLARAYGKEWSTSRQEALLAQVDYAGDSLEDWLCNGFFEQHCALFHQRPFIWHIWDGLKNGFSVLVNYHKLTHANLEKLTFAYLGDWIRRQQAAVAAEEAGSDAKLQAAKELQATLKLILEGEPPYDIFVRWKALNKQAIGWHPDLNDGVRMNIRPFMLAKDVGNKGAGILRAKPNIKWDKDRGKEPHRDKADYPWFWGWDEEKQDFVGGRDFTGDRWNNCHYTNEFKRERKKAQGK